MHQDNNLIAILKILQDCETPDEVLHQQLFVELKHKVPLVYDYIVCFRLNNEPANTVRSCLMDEMEHLRDFHGKNESLAFKHRDTIIGLLFEVKAQRLINQKQDFSKQLSEHVDESLSIENNETNEPNRMLTMSTAWLVC